MRGTNVGLPDFYRTVDLPWFVAMGLMRGFCKKELGLLTDSMEMSVGKMGFWQVIHIAAIFFALFKHSYFYSKTVLLLGFKDKR